ncbi:DUF4157 domain-containing protein [Pedobacter sp. HMF7647]|uniref:DUF4157 domain-containing protein n=1 Tax=Hufsiella arboris TaxID=2695275 RepID=A0A7K1Y6D5_9SPHI|nr:DUF4157 domain-containing protein [Hufsiella arboris]MXV49679.1 DUF4157 domain-containing protein [Hufsiella arboris]
MFALEKHSENNNPEGPSVTGKCSPGVLNIQRKLTVGSPDDQYEREADSIAEQVVSGSGSNFVQRKCAHCEEEEKLQRKESNQSGSEQVATESIAGSISSSKGNGTSIDNRTQSFMSDRFGSDFSNVTIHTDQQAVQLSRNLNARAFTTGSDIYFGEGQYRPQSPDGQKLLAHELTHVLQQSSSHAPVVQRQLASDPGNIDYVDQRDGAPKAKSCAPPSNCPATFCQPFKSENLARSQRDKTMFFLLAGIGAVVDSRVMPLWSEYLLGGSPPQNLSAKFGADFAASPTTKATTNFLLGALKNKLTASVPTFPAGSMVTTVDILTLIPTELAAINTSGDANEMNFNIPKDIAGNLAGGIGDNQTACKSGAQPSPFNDMRLATGAVTLVKSKPGEITVIPIINYTVKDTIDLCPGNCGTSAEQLATVPMSQFEATGISGDVPFTVEFSPVVFPFTIPNP